MSLLSRQTNITPNDYFFLLANISTLTAGNIVANSITASNAKIGDISANNISTGNLLAGVINTNFLSVSSIETANIVKANEFSSIFTYADEGTVSTLFTQHIILDQATLDVVNGNSLLLNGVPIATTQDLSTIQDWAVYPAVSTLYMVGNNINGAGNITCQNIYNALAIQTDTLSALTSLTTPSATGTNLRFQNVSTTNLVASNALVGSNLNVLQTLNASNINTNRISTATLGVSSIVASNISTVNLLANTINGVPVISGSNWSQYPATSDVNLNGFNIGSPNTLTIQNSNNLTIQNRNASLVNDAMFLKSGQVSITGDYGANITTVPTVAIASQNGLGGRVNITADTGTGGTSFGTIALTANGGTTSGVGTGGLITLTANTPLGTLSNASSAIKISAAGVNSYAGAIPPIGSLTGYNFIYGTLGVNIAAGLPAALPNTVGTTYIYGTNGVEIPSQAYMYGIEPYWDGLTTPPDLNITGRYIIPNLAQVCVRMSNVRQINFQENVGTFMSNCDNIAMSSNGVITTSNLGATNATIGTLSNTNLVGTGSVSGYTTIGGTTFNGTNATFTTLSNTNIVGAGSGQITGYTQFSTLNVNLSSINNFTSFGSKSIRVQGDVAQIQLSNNNPAGAGTILNLLSRVGASEIQSFNSNFTTPLPLFLNASEVSTPSLLVSSINGLPYPADPIFGEFQTTTTITVSAANTPTVIPLDTNTVGNGINLDAGDVEFLTAGLYEYSFNVQLDKSGGGIDICDLWLRLNGSDIAGTGSRISIQGNAGQCLAVCSFLVSVNAGDKIAIVFASADATMAATFFPAWTTSGGDPYDRPSVPANIVQVKRIR